MDTSPARRSFLKQLAGLAPVLLAGTQFAGCLSDSDEQQPKVSGSVTQTTAPTASTTPTTPAEPSQQAANSGPVWQTTPTIEFVEGVPAVVSVREFVQDPDQDPLVITLKSGTLLPGITWDPNKYTITYDGRPLGAKPDAPVVVSGVTFSADDRK